MVSGQPLDLSPHRFGIAFSDLAAWQKEQSCSRLFRSSCILLCPSCFVLLSVTFTYVFMLLCMLSHKCLLSLKSDQAEGPRLRAAGIRLVALAGLPDSNLGLGIEFR